MVTDVPKPPIKGLNEVIIGGGKKVNPAIVDVPKGVVTDTLPEEPSPT